MFFLGAVVASSQAVSWRSGGKLLFNPLRVGSPTRASPARPSGQTPSAPPRVPGPGATSKLCGPMTPGWSMLCLKKGPTGCSLAGRKRPAGRMAARQGEVDETWSPHTAKPGDSKLVTKVGPQGELALARRRCAMGEVNSPVAVMQMPSSPPKHYAH